MEELSYIMTYNELKDLVKQHSHSYYDLSAPVITDAEFDGLYEDLEAVEKAQGWSTNDSPTSKVGGKAGKVTHAFQLYSLKKVYDVEEVDKRFTVETPKIDGSCLTITYVRGKMRVALTRGNGEMGDNVTHLAVNIKNIPIKFTTDLDELVVTGECVTDNNVENFRNYVAGAMGLKSAEEFKSRNIKFIVHDVLNLAIDYTKRMKIAEAYGFTTVLSKEATEYPKDGLVYRMDSYKESHRLGYTSKHPRFAIALKPRGANTTITTLQDVLWVVGRTGTVNPTAVIDPVVLEDATISRVTLHNMDFIESHNLGLGDTIVIERAGGVIPKFIRVEEHALHNLKITAKDAEKAIGQAVVRNGPKLFVADKANVNYTKIVENFIKLMEIKGLGPANVKKMGITNISDLYKDQDWDSLGAVGAKIKEEIERSKLRPYQTVLSALGIPSVGRNTSKLIVPIIPKFSRLSEVEYTDIHGVGPATIEAILFWLEDNKEWVEELPLNLEQKIEVATLIKPSGKGKVCITGKLDMTRNQLADILEGHGYKVTTTVTNDCYALINGGDNSSSKCVKASKLGINVVDYWASKKLVIDGNF